MIRVWDRLVRFAHWLLVACVAGAWITHEDTNLRRHEWFGYATLAIIFVRIAWGFRRGAEHARFANFVRPPSETYTYARAMLRGTSARFVGHNPLGGWMIVALLFSVFVTGITGWLITTDRFWGNPTIERIHAWGANALLVLVLLHVCGVIASSLLHKENLVKAMFTGNKKS